MLSSPQESQSPTGIKSGEGNTEGFCKYINSKRKTGENLLLYGTGARVSNIMEKAEVCNAFFVSVWSKKSSLGGRGSS